MSGLLTKTNLCVKYGSDVYYFYLWSSPKYFGSNLAFCVKFENRILYIPCHSDSDYMEKVWISGGTIRIYNKNTWYYFLAGASNLDETKECALSYSCNVNTNQIFVSFQGSCSNLQLLGMIFKIKITNIKRTGGLSNIVENCEVTTNSIAEKSTGVSVRKSFLIEKYKGRPVIRPEPYDETVRITCEGTDFQKDITLDYETERNFSDTIVIPLTEN